MNHTLYRHCVPCHSPGPFFSIEVDGSAGKLTYLLQWHIFWRCSQRHLGPFYISVLSFWPILRLQDTFLKNCNCPVTVWHHSYSSLYIDSLVPISISKKGVWHSDRMAWFIHMLIQAIDRVKRSLDLSSRKSNVCLTCENTERQTELFSQHSIGLRM